MYNPQLKKGDVIGVVKRDFDDNRKLNLHKFEIESISKTKGEVFYVFDKGKRKANAEWVDFTTELQGKDSELVIVAELFGVTEKLESKVREWIKRKNDRRWM